MTTLDEVDLLMVGSHDFVTTCIHASKLCVGHHGTMMSMNNSNTQVK